MVIYVGVFPTDELRSELHALILDTKLVEVYDASYTAANVPLNTSMAALLSQKSSIVIGVDSSMKNLNRVVEMLPDLLTNAGVPDLPIIWAHDVWPLPSHLKALNHDCSLAYTRVHAKGKS